MLDADEGTDAIESGKVGLVPLRVRVFGLAESECLLSSARIASDCDDVQLVLRSLARVVDHSWPDRRKPPADGLVGCEPKREVSSDVFEMRAQHMRRESGLGVRPRLGGLAIFESSEVAAGHDVVEANDWVGELIDRPPRAQSVVGSREKPSVHERCERMLNRSLLPPQRSCDGRLAGIAVGDRSHDGVVQRSIGDRLFFGQGVVVFPEQCACWVERTGSEPSSEIARPLRRICGDEVAVPGRPAEYRMQVWISGLVIGCRRNRRVLSRRVAQRA